MSTTRADWETVYIDGVKRQGLRCGVVLFVDTDEMPRRRCSAITLSVAAWKYTETGSVRTSGVSISRVPPPQKPLPVIPVTPFPAPKPKSLLSKLVDVFKEHYK